MNDATIPINSSSPFSIMALISGSSTNPNNTADSSASIQSSTSMLHGPASTSCSAPLGSSSCKEQPLQSAHAPVKGIPKCFSVIRSETTTSFRTACLKIESRHKALQVLTDKKGAHPLCALTLSKQLTEETQKLISNSIITPAQNAIAEFLIQQKGTELTKLITDLSIPYFIANAKAKFYEAVGFLNPVQRQYLQSPINNELDELKNELTSMMIDCKFNSDKQAMKTAHLSSRDMEIMDDFDSRKLPIKVNINNNQNDVININFLLNTINAATSSTQQAAAKKRSSQVFEAATTAEEENWEDSPKEACAEAASQQSSCEASSEKDSSSTSKKSQSLVINKYGFNNLTRVQLPKEVTKLLSRGLDYSPSFKGNSPCILKEFSNVTNAIIDVYILRFPRLEQYLKVLQSVFNSNLALEIENYYKNFKNKDCIQFLLRFLTDHKLIIKPADKNLGLTVMNMNWYDMKTKDHLADEKTYKRVDVIDSQSIKKSLWDIVDKHVSKHESTYKILRRIPFECNAPEFYTIPKIHKTPITTRPIIPCINWFTTHVSKWLDEKLQAFVNKFEWIAHNSIQVVNRLETCKVPKARKLVSADATSLYTRIDTKEAIRKISWLLLTTKLASEQEVHLIADLLQWVMGNNYFQYRKELYKQIKGTAMGSNVAPSFANLFVASLEYKVQKDHNKLWPNIYFRYIDDIFFIWEGNLQDLGVFKNILNSMSSSIELNFTVNSCSVAFLDLKICKRLRWSNSQLLDIQNYIKPMSIGKYTDPSSYQTNSVKYNWISGELIRLTRNSSTIKQFTKSTHKFRIALIRNNYSNKIISEQFKKITYSKRAEYLSSKPKIETTPVVNIFTTNIPGRHIMMKHVYKFLKTAEACEEIKENKLNIRLVVKKGRKLQDIINKNNKILLMCDSLEHMSNTEE